MDDEVEITADAEVVRMCSGGVTTPSHDPAEMEQDWMWRDVYRCPICKAVEECGDES